MPIVLKGELCNMKLNGHEDFKKYAGIEKSTNGTDDAQNFPAGVLVSDDVLPECSLCEITFESRRDYETHFLSLEHAQKVLKQNNLITVPSDTYNIFASPLKNQSEKICVDEIDKQEQLGKSPCSSKADNESKVFQSPESPYSCSYCITKFSGPEPYKQHIESKSHQKKVALKNNSFAEIKKIDGHMFCDICNKEFSGEKPYNEHLISKKHRMIEQRFKFLGKNADEDSAPEAKKIKIESKSEIDKQFFCETCEISCSGPIPFSAHLAGNAHKKNVARSQARVSIEPFINQLDSLQTNNNSINYVNVAAKNVSDLACSENMKRSVQVLKENSDDYSFPEAKKFKIEPASGKEKQWFCEICRKQCNGPVPYSQHLAGNDHKKKEARSQAGVNIEPSVNQLYTLPNNSNINHVNIASKNVSDPACTDGIANLSLTQEKIEAEKEDKIEIDKPKPAWFCRVCNVQCTGPVDFSHHLGGKSHKKKEMYQKGNDCDKPKDSIDSDRTESNVYGSTGESSFGSQKQNMCSEKVDYEGELKKSIEIFSPDGEINFD